MTMNSMAPSHHQNLQLCMEKNITDHLDPVKFSVENESYKHSGRPHAETHFNIVVVSEKFQDLTLLKRHRLVYEVLKKEFAKIKAYSLHVFTTTEWDKNAQDLGFSQDLKSPDCAHKA